MARGASAASSERIPQANKQARIDSRVEEWASTTRARTHERSTLLKMRGGRVDSLCLEASMGTSSQNSEPRPCSLTTPICPFMSLANCAQMASPRPVPPYLRVVDTSTCANFSNKEPSLSEGMPIPVSRTERRSRMLSPARDSSETRTSTPPSWVNLMALPKRFSRIWRSRA